MFLPKLPLPIPPYVILEGFKFICDIITCKSKETAEKASEKEALKEGKASLEDVSDINKSFDNLIISLKSNTDKMENQIIEALSYYLGDFIFLLEEKENILKDIKINKISREFKRIEKNFKGSLSKELYKEISLDNHLCRDILALPKGDKKKLKMEQFIQNSIDTSLQTIISEIKEEILYITEDIEMVITDNLAILETQQIEKNNTYKQLQTELNETEKLKIKNDATMKIVTIEFLESFLKEVV